MHRSFGPFRHALRERAVWRRSVRLGIGVGLVQVALHQGDHWVRGEITRTIILKSITSILFAIFVVLLASASTRAAAIETNRSP